MRVEFVPLLSFDFCNQEALVEAYQHPEDFSGMIFTSQQAVQALLTALRRAPLSVRGMAKAWAAKSLYCVGRQTESEVQKAFHTLFEESGEECVPVHTRGSEAGNARALSLLILREAPTQPLLFLCGACEADTQLEMRH